MPTEDHESLLRFWKAVYDGFDPDEPVTVPELRVPRDEKYSPAEQALPSLLSDFGVQRVLVAGAIGSGKSTELLTIAERLGAAGRVVVSFDLGHHMEYSVKDPGAIERLQAWEVVGLVGLAVLRAGTRRWGHAWRGGRRSARQGVVVAIRWGRAGRRQAGHGAGGHRRGSRWSSLQHGARGPQGHWGRVDLEAGAARRATTQ